MHNIQFWGSATVGTKGQVVIPAKARNKLKILEGEQLIFFSPPGKPALMAIKPEVFEKFMLNMQNKISKTLNTYSKSGFNKTNKK